MRLTGWSKSLIALGLGMVAGTTHAATVAVVDSGLDTEQKELAAKIWLNPIDSTVNGIDEDNNGYTDDIHGWSFADNSYQLIDHKYSNLYDADISRFFSVQALSLKGKAAAEDKEWAKSQAQDSDFVKKLMTYGNYAHGTHVSGIIANQGDDIKVIGIKLIPTEGPLGSVTRAVLKANALSHLTADGDEIDPDTRKTILDALDYVAQTQAQAFVDIGKYIGTEKADVVNGSFGLGPVQARTLLTPVLTLALGKEPSPALVDEFVKAFLSKILDKQKVFVEGAPEALFVFAAGNDANDNDKLPTSPASIKDPRVISVAAVFDDGRLAPFSSYGAESVDLAAPGVAVESTVPDNLRLALSGTSQAAPLVAGAAAAVKSINTALSAVDLKKVLLNTVDLKDNLKGKVGSSGVLNTARAKEAARLSLNVSLDEAIAQAKANVADLPTPTSFAGPADASLFIDFQPHLLGVKK